ncbi:MAG: ABC-F family ATP-binding cassette domain-containing protein [Cryobacterium sp.]|nr:ABC-F family ATP-binding cassette domain-containing protein [Cryobacterium sp.]
MSTLEAIVVRDASVSYAGRPALSGISFTASPGHRVALVGENGAGKSTLLRAIADQLPSTAQFTGSMVRPSDLIWLDQEPPFADDSTVAEVLATALAPLRDAVAELERLSHLLDDPESALRYSEVLEWATAHDAWDADRRALLFAEEFGVGGLDPERLVGSLSGGQRARLALATSLTRRPAALLLDEPTNHLDDGTLELLGQRLSELSGVVLFASHDRVFLDDVATDLVDLDPTALGTDGEGGRRFGGGWSDYESARTAARARWEQRFATEQDELNRLRTATRIGTDSIAPGRGPRDNDKFIHKFKGANVDRTLARRKKDAERRLAEAEATQVRKPPPLLRFSAPLGASGTSGPMVTGTDLRVAGRLSLPSLEVATGEHVLVTGANGVGKSTLLGAIAGRVRLDSGTLNVSARRVGELTQDPEFRHPERSPQQLYEPLAARGMPTLADLGLLHARDAARPLRELSVGQRRRFALAVIIASAPDLLLLDEPTNHISLALAGELEEAVGASAGTILVASHDRWLRRRWGGRELALRLENGSQAR